MANLGVHIQEKATAQREAKTAKVSIPYVVGAAPVQAAAHPTKAGVPVLVRSWDEVVDKLGYSNNWESYTLCEFMYSHFRLYGCQPVIFCNLLDPTKHEKAVEAADHTVADHKVSLPISALADTVKVKAKVDVDGAPTLKDLTAGTDYAVFYTSHATGSSVLTVELLEDGSAYDATTLNIAYTAADPSALTEADAAEGVAQVDACMTVTGVIPDLICAPGWSHRPALAALMATKAASVNGLFSGKALIDVDSGAEGVTKFDQIPDYKAEKGLVDPNQILCWPMVMKGGNRFHLSTHLAGSMAQVDAANRGIPYESPSNKPLQIDGCCLEDGTEVNLTWEQVNLLAGSWGVVTAANFPDIGWAAKGNYTACYPGNSDVKDHFIPVSRMFDFIGNTLIRMFWHKLDKPLTIALRDSILQSCNNWLGGLCGSGYLYGARVELLAAENPLEDVKNGVIRLHVYNAPPVPNQEIDFILEYDVSYMETALTA